MTRFDPRRDDADRLNDYLDDLATGEPAPRSDLEPDFAKTVSRVHGPGSATAPPHLKAAIWEDLMSTSNVSDTVTRAAPIQPGARIGQTGSGWLSTFAPGQSRTSHFGWLAAAIALFALLGGILDAALQPGGSNPGSTNGNHALFAPEISTPIAPQDGRVYPPAEACTVPELPLTEITMILSLSFWGEEGEMGGSTRDLPLTPADNQTLQPPLPEGVPVDNETRAAIDQVFYTYLACLNAGSIRQQYWLFSNDGIARTLMPDGNPYFYNIAQIGQSPQRPGGFTPMPDWVDMRLLPDGRVAAISQQRGTDELAIAFWVFAEYNGTWYIDDRYCGICG